MKPCPKQHPPMFRKVVKLYNRAVQCDMFIKHRIIEIIQCSIIQDVDFVEDVEEKKELEKEKITAE
jgi:malonyl CoA-acyl carrier protein transacylase